MDEVELNLLTQEDLRTVVNAFNRNRKRNISDDVDIWVGSLDGRSCFIRYGDRESSNFEFDIIYLEEFEIYKEITIEKISIYLDKYQLNDFTDREQAKEFIRRLYAKKEIPKDIDLWMKLN